MFMFSFPILICTGTGMYTRLEIMHGSLK